MLIPPHRTISRTCKISDINRIYTDAAEMLRMCSEQRGRMAGAFAIAHAQITKKDPLRFFVTKEGEIICNPVIEKHSKTTGISKEHCYTFFYMEKPGEVERWNIIEISYKELIDDKLVEKKEKLSGKKAKIWQHEINHMDGKYVYEIDFEAIEKEEAEYEAKQEELKDKQSIDLLK